MKEVTYTITDMSGIHARPAGLLVKEAVKYQANITIKLSHSEKTADAKRLFSVMALNAKCGDTLTIKIEGTDEDTALIGLEKFLKENL